MSDEIAVCTRIRARPDEAGRSVLDGQSKILNWLGNRLLDEAARCRDALARISSYAEDPTLPPEIRAEVLAPAWDLVMCAYSPYGLRNLVPAMKDRHPFLRLAHSSPVKNAALRITDAIKAHVTAKREGREVGWPKYKKWSRDWHSIEYDEKKGWKVEGRTLHLSLGSRVVPDTDLDAGQKRALAKRRRKDPAAVQQERLTLAMPLDEAPTALRSSRVWANTTSCSPTRSWLPAPALRRPNSSISIQITATSPTA